MRCIARSAARRISSVSERRGSGLSSVLSRKSLNPTMIIIMLLRSCAMPPAKRPTASIFCACRTWLVGLDPLGDVPSHADDTDHFPFRSALR